MKKIKGIICYYSGSGNTKLACEYLSRKIENADFELRNIVREKAPDFSAYDIAGFATFTDFGAPPQYMYSFVKNIVPQNGKTAFVLNTYGFISFKTLPALRDLVESAGFSVFTGFSLHTPESYPPMRRRGRDFDNAPNPKELMAFDEFVTRLDAAIGGMRSGRVITFERIKYPSILALVPGYSRKKAKSDFGIQNVKAELCNECGVCAKGCPYGAIALDPKPVFDHEKCRGCWYCYNHCRPKAIYTKRFRGEYQYPKPSDELRRKLIQNN